MENYLNPPLVCYHDHTILEEIEDNKLICKNGHT